EPTSWRQGQWGYGSWVGLLFWRAIEHRGFGQIRPIGEIGEIGNEVGGPIDAAMAQPRSKKGFASMLGMDARDGGLIGFGRSGAKREADFAQTQLEQAIAAPRLTIIVPLGRSPRQDLDLPVV